MKAARLGFSSQPGMRPMPSMQGRPGVSFRHTYDACEDLVEEERAAVGGRADDGYGAATGCSRYVAQPHSQLGVWVIEAGPADGDWSSLDSVMILSSSVNASIYMLGEDVDLTGFALHPVRLSRGGFGEL